MRTAGLISLLTLSATASHAYEVKQAGPEYCTTTLVVDRKCEQHDKEARARQEVALFCAQKSEFYTQEWIELRWPQCAPFLSTHPSP